MEEQLIENLRRKRILNLHNNNCSSCDNVKHIALCFTGKLSTKN